MENKIILLLALITILVTERSSAAFTSLHKQACPYVLYNPIDTRISLADKYNYETETERPVAFSNALFRSTPVPAIPYNSKKHGWCNAHKYGFISSAGGAGLIILGYFLLFTIGKNDASGDGGSKFGAYMVGLGSIALLLGIPVFIAGAIHDSFYY